MNENSHNGERPNVREAEADVQRARDHDLHPAWQALIRYCEKLQFGELEKIKIQNGLPMTVEVIRSKMRLRAE